MGIKTYLSAWVGPIGDTLSSCNRAILVEWIAKRGRAGHAPAPPYEDDSEDLLRRGDAIHQEMCACKTRPPLATRDAFARTIRMADKVEQLTATVVKQQHHIEDLTGRVIRLETALELALGSKRLKKLSGPSS